MDDICEIIFRFVDFSVVKQKELCLVCKTWKLILDTRIADRLDFTRMGRLSIQVIENFPEKMRWYNLRNSTLSEAFMEKFANNLYWTEISWNQKLSEAFIEKFTDNLDWTNISWSQKLSESFIEKFADKVNWGEISKHQKLSEAFIEKFAERVDWYEISVHQELSETFIDEFANRMGII